MTNQTKNEKPTPNKVFKKVWASNLFNLNSPFKSLQRWIVTSSSFQNFLKYVFVSSKFKKKYSELIKREVVVYYEKHFNDIKCKIFAQTNIDILSSTDFKKELYEEFKLETIQFDTLTHTKKSISYKGLPKNIIAWDTALPNSGGIVDVYLFKFGINTYLNSVEILKNINVYNDEFKTNIPFNISTTEINFEYFNYYNKPVVDILSLNEKFYSEYTYQVNSIVNNINDISNFNNNIHSYIVSRILLLYLHHR